MSGCTIAAPQWWPVPPYIPPVVNYPLTVTKTGTGTGTVTAPPSLNCGATCTASYAQGAAVTLTASTTAGATFTGWSGACSGAATTCNVTMSTAQNVTANFNPAADAIPPPNPSAAAISAPTAGPTSVSYTATWSAVTDQPCNCPVPTYLWDVNNGDWTGFLNPGGTVSTLTVNFTVPYDASGLSVLAHFGLSARDATGNQNTAGHTWTDFTIPAAPAGQLTANWIAPTQNTDNSALTVGSGSADLASYRIYYGAGGGNPCPSGSFVAASGSVLTATITGLASGTSYTASIVAVNTSGTASACSPTATGVAHP